MFICRLSISSGVHLLRFFIFALQTSEIIQKARLFNLHGSCSLRSRRLVKSILYFPRYREAYEGKKSNFHSRRIPPQLFNSRRFNEPNGPPKPQKPFMNFFGKSLIPLSLSLFRGTKALKCTQNCSVLSLKNRKRLTKRSYTNEGS